MTLLPMENRESILHALKCFGKDKPTNIPQILEDYLKQVARSGQTMLPWIFIKPLILHKFNKVVDSLVAECTFSDYSLLSQGVNELRQRVFNTLRTLDGIPFTIQRMCELLENPFRHYSRPDKFLRGFEKVCLVVSTVDPQGNKILREDPRFPSQAGLEGCDISFGEGQSPSSSPSMDEVHRRTVSKSSDDDEMTEDDDTEGVYDNHAGSSSSSPSDSAATNPIPVPPTSSSWSDSTSNADTATSKSSEDNGTTLNTDSLLSPESKGAVDAIGSMASGFNELPSSCTYLSDSPKTSQVADISEHVPPIVQILRPIGQLEAFVQNMGTDIPPISSCLLNQATSSEATSFHDSSDDDQEMPCETGESKASTPVTPRRAGKRRSMSPITEDAELSDSSDSGSEVAHDPSLSVFEQSPAKRRRLSGSFTDAPGVDVQPSTLNDSPPIILCNPDSNNRQPASSDPVSSCRLSFTEEIASNGDEISAEPKTLDIEMPTPSSLSPSTPKPENGDTEVVDT